MDSMDTQWICIQQPVCLCSGEKAGGELAVGTIEGLYVGVEALHAQDPWKVDMRCFVPEAWSEHHDLRRMFDVLALPKLPTSYGRRVAHCDPAISLAMQFKLDEDRQLWSCLVMCEPLKGTP